MEELTEGIDEILTEEEQELAMILNSIVDEDGIIRLNNKAMKKLPKTKGKKRYFGGTLTGYKTEYFDRPMTFERGAHERAIPKWIGVPVITWHNHKMINIGEIEEAFMSKEDLKVIYWVDHPEYADAIENRKLKDLSSGIKPIKYRLSDNKKKVVVKEYIPKEQSILLEGFAGYELAKTELVGTSKEAVMKAMLGDSQIEKFEAEKPIVVTNMTSENLKDKIKELEEEVLTLEKNKKILEFQTKYATFENVDEISELIKKYNISEEDASKLLIKEEVEVKTEEVKVEVTEEVKEEVKDETEVVEEEVKVLEVKTPEEKTKQLDERTNDKLKLKQEPIPEGKSQEEIAHDEIMSTMEERIKSTTKMGLETLE